MNLSIDGGVTFVEIQDYSYREATPIPGDPPPYLWTGDSGQTITTAGTYVLQAQDAAHTGVLSSFYTLVVASSGGGGGGSGGPTYTLNAPSSLPGTIALDLINIIPLQNYAQQFTISLAGVTYTLRTYWNNQISGWVIDISDVDNNPIACGIPLVTGTDLLGQLKYLEWGGSLYVATTGNPLVPPTYENLGVTSYLYFVADAAL